MAKKVDKPDILEFLKQTRTIIRQLKIFKGIKGYTAESEVINKAAVELKKALDEYLEGD